MTTRNIFRQAQSYANLSKKNTFYGLYTGIVTSINNEDGNYMVKVSFPSIHIDGEHASFWARVSSIMAGPSTGMHLLPEMGEEVVCGFADGDDRQPIVLGCLWNGTDTCLASASSLAGDVSMPISEQSEENNVRALVTKNGQQIVLNEKDGEAFISIKSGNGHEIVISDVDGTEQIQITNADGDNRVQFDITNGVINFEVLSGDGVMNIETAKDLNITVGANLNIDVTDDLNITVGGTYNNDTSADINMTSGGTINVDASGDINETATTINLN